MTYYQKNDQGNWRVVRLPRRSLREDLKAIDVGEVAREAPAIAAWLPERGARELATRRRA